MVPRAEVVASGAAAEISGLDKYCLDSLCGKAGVSVCANTWSGQRRDQQEEGQVAENLLIAAARGSIEP